MQLSREKIININNQQVQTPGLDYFELPEKVLQFGTGVLLRGLPDYYIDKANKQKIFNGRIVMVKSTGGGDGIDIFNNQDGMYTQCMQGIDQGKRIEKNIINASVSRVLSATHDWDKVLDCAINPSIQVVISNTTEIGITLVDDRIDARPPISFPGKLLAFLYRRFRHFDGDKSMGMIIIPTELVPANGTVLKNILDQLSTQNNLGETFRDWLLNANIFCSSLVDRIVPGKLSPTAAKALQETLGYHDDLAIMSEIYGLWAIETKEEKVKNILSFHATDEGVVLTEDISVFRELKLRLLNGSHTFTCGLAILAGFKTVKQAMEDKVFEAFITRLMMDEIVPSVTNEKLGAGQAGQFASQVLDRYRNPFIEHQWISITLQYTSKMGMRNMPLFKTYIQRYGSVPEFMALGMAAWLLFMKSTKAGDGKYYGELNGNAYPVNDDQAKLLSEAWDTMPVDKLVATVLSNKNLWKEDISLLPGLAAMVTKKLQELANSGAMAMMREHVLGDTSKDMNAG